MMHLELMCSYEWLLIIEQTGYRYWLASVYWRGAKDEVVELGVA